MPNRYYLVPVLILWCASMTWLVTRKVLPLLTAGTPPEYGEILPRRAVSLAPVRWTVRWNDRNIGWAENRISRSIDGTGNVVSEVQLRDLSVSEMIGDLLGFFGRLARPVIGEEFAMVDLRVLTKFDFDNYGALRRFDTVVDLGDARELLQIFGRVESDQLELVAKVDGVPHENNELFRRSLRLPPDALIVDSFSPRPRMSNLRIGQSWTFQSYRPLMPHSPLELIEARVEREELLDWEGQLLTAKVVAYRREGGSGLSAGQTPMSLAWVLEDGTVIRQDLSLANVQVQFLRVSTKAADSQTDGLAGSSGTP